MRAARDLAVLVLAAGLAFGSASNGRAAAPPESVVRLSGSVEGAADGQFAARAKVEIAPGFHVNAHHPSADFLIPTELTLSGPGASFGAPTYPEPVARSFAFSSGEKLLVYDGTFEIVARSPHAPEGPVVARLRYQACDEERCLPPKTVEATLSLRDAAAAAPASAGGAAIAAPPRSGSGDSAGSGPPDGVAESGSAAAERPPWLARWLAGASLPAALAMTLVLGLTLNLTPCVYPLLSITIAYFGSQLPAGKRTWPLALAYVGGITLSFAALGVSASMFGGLVGGPLQHPAVPVAIALLLVALAGSSFGLFEIRAPTVLLQRFGRASAGGLGALLMGLTMGIVAAPCIGPVVLGLLVYVGAKHDLMLGFLLFLSMGLGMGLPYIVLASAAGGLKALPRSGEWLRWMNRFFGVLLLGMALYFVEPLLGPAAVQVLVPLFLACAGIYLGFLEPSGRRLRGFMTARRALGAATVALAAWLALFAAEPSAQARATIRWQPLTVAALDRAIAAKRPAIVEFGADWCIPCGLMERTTFADADVAREAGRFSMLQADVTESTPANESLLSRFGVMGVPTIIFYDPAGNEIDRVVGYVDARRFIELMKRVPSREGPPESRPPGPDEPRAPAPDRDLPGAGPA